MKKIILCLDGFFIGNIVRRLLGIKTNQLEEIVRDVAGKDISAQIYYNVSGLGAWRDMYRIALENNFYGRELILIGKSFGAKRMCQILDKMKSELRYSRVSLILIDAEWIFRMLLKKFFHKNRFFLVVPDIDVLFHVYQINSYMGSAPVVSKAHYSFTKEINEPGYNHFSIINHPEVRNSIVTSVYWQA